MSYQITLDAPYEACEGEVVAVSVTASTDTCKYGHLVLDINYHKVREDSGTLCPGEKFSLTHMFTMPDSDVDIRAIVYGKEGTLAKKEQTIESIRPFKVEGEVWDSETGNRLSCVTVEGPRGKSDITGPNGNFSIVYYNRVSGDFTASKLGYKSKTHDKNSGRSREQSTKFTG